jgi:hypothetical protein
MRVEGRRKIHQARPFRPVRIRVADRKEYAVSHAEFMAFSVTGRTIHVATPDDWFEMIDTRMITSVHVGHGENSSRRSMRKK